MKGEVEKQRETETEKRRETEGDWLQVIEGLSIYAVRPVRSSLFSHPFYPGSRVIDRLLLNKGACSFLPLCLHMWLMISYWPISLVSPPLWHFPLCFHQGTMDHSSHTHHTLPTAPLIHGVTLIALFVSTYH